MLCLLLQEQLEDFPGPFPHVTGEALFTHSCQCSSFCYNPCMRICVALLVVMNSARTSYVRESESCLQPSPPSCILWQPPVL